MNLNQLRTFVEVFRQRSISAAARNLAVTQPSVSQHIAGLEAAIGRSLFVRSVHGVTPTAAAVDLAADLGDRLDMAEAALAAARARSAVLSGTVQIVGHGDFLSEVIAPALRPLLEQGIRIAMRSSDLEGVTTALVDGQADLGFCAFPITDRRLRSQVVHQEAICAVAAPAVVFRLLAAPALGAALAAEPLLAYTYERPLVDGWLEHNGFAGVTVLPAMIGQDLRGLCRLLAAGYGWTVLPTYLCRDALARGELTEIPALRAPPVNTYYLVWAPVALRQPRVAYARERLLAALTRATASGVA